MVVLELAYHHEKFALALENGVNKNRAVEGKIRTQFAGMLVVDSLFLCDLLELLVLSFSHVGC